MLIKSDIKTSSKPISIFFSYTHRDQKLRDQLEEQLSFLKRVGEIETWHDRIIRPGDEWENQIDEKLNEADIILLLISPAFAKSNYCYDIEMMRAMERHERGEAIVIPVILRPTSNWQKAPFGKLQALPNDNKAVTSRAWKNRDEAFKVVADGINSVLENKQHNSSFNVDLPKWTLTIDGDFSKFSDDRIQMVTKQLLKLTNDYLLTFIEKSLGSVSLKFQSTCNAFLKIQESYKDGALEKYLGLSIKNLTEDIGALIRIESKIVDCEVKSFTRYLPEIFGGVSIEDGWAPLVTGMVISHSNPIHPGFKVVCDASQEELSEDEVIELQARLGRYLNTFLVVEGEQLHVSLSPYEAYGGLSEPLRYTELGRDLLAQDVVLKYYTAQLLHPDTDLGKTFWSRIDTLGLEAKDIESCVRVWIVPGKVSLKESAKKDGYFHVDIEKLNLKVLCESEYKTLNKFKEKRQRRQSTLPLEIHKKVVEVFNDIILPEINVEVNSGNRFSILRQVYSVMIFSTWFEKSSLGLALIKSGFMNSNNIEKYQLNTVGDEAIRMKEQYLKMFDKGVWQHTQTFYDSMSKEIKRKVYIVGGIQF
ncbi:MAG: toll/interleukin-1 receptor domain-containing protein [Sedimentisphaerales bacterium]|nr:toll/interleukin-1 receptor domain-containing protein [Sedimentisphaerales bacterium]